MKNGLTSLNELAKKMNVNKSKLYYYVFLGMLIPMTKIGNMMLFNLEESEKILNFIKEQRKSNILLKDIKEKLNKK